MDNKQQNQNQFADQANISALGRNPDGTIKRRPTVNSAKKELSVKSESSQTANNEYNKAEQFNGALQATQSKEQKNEQTGIQDDLMGKNRKKIGVLIGVGILVVLLVFGGYFYKDLALAWQAKWRLVSSNVQKLFGQEGFRSPPKTCPADTKLCPDGTIVKRELPDCQFPACPDKESAHQEKKQIVFSGNLSFLRDAKRVADIKRIQRALENYKKDWGGYPTKLVFGGRLTKKDKVYLFQIPSDPQPESQAYSYRSFSPQAYALFFYLEEGRGQLPKGKIVAVPLGIFEAKDTDSDGLDDQEESQYGTDLYSVDTDRDGYGDLDELKAGYNPIGKGKMKK